MNAPKRLFVEYEDGTQKAVDFSAVDSRLRSDLARLGLCLPPAAIATAAHYAVLEWKDGWREVIAVPGDAVDLVRYYVISRVEDRGRASFEAGDYWPQLSIIKRSPRDVKSALLIAGSGAKAYALEAEMERWEGTFEAGGKKEYVKFDKTNDRAPQESRDAPERLETMTEAVRGELSRKGIAPEALLAADEASRIETYKAVALSMGLFGKERQADVYGLIELLVKRL